MKKILVLATFLLSSCIVVDPVHEPSTMPIYEPDCSSALLDIPLPPLWSLDDCWDNCCMYTYQGCQETYCYWETDYDCYWELVELYCW